MNADKINYNNFWRKSRELLPKMQILRFAARKGAFWYEYFIKSRTETELLCTILPKIN